MEKEEKQLTDMKVGEFVEHWAGTPGANFVLRVPGGWVFTFWADGNNSAVFVPYPSNPN